MTKEELQAKLAEQTAQMEELEAKNALQEEILASNATAIGELEATVSKVSRTSTSVGAVANKGNVALVVSLEGGKSVSVNHGIKTGKRTLTRDELAEDADLIEQLLEAGSTAVTAL